MTGNGGGIQQNTTVTLTVVAPPDFTISASPSSLSVQQGNQGTSTITTTISGGFNSSIALSYSGAPSGTTVSFNPNPIPSPGNGSSTMTITVGSTTPTGTYPITVTGNGGGIQHNATVTLTVTAGGQKDFAISASPSQVTVVQGSNGTSTITTTISGGFNSGIALSASGAPSGTFVNFQPIVIGAPGAGNSTMYILVGSGTPVGTYPITVTGYGGGIQHNTTVTLTVIVQPPNFTISASPSSVTIQQGTQDGSTITSTISGGFNSSIALSASGQPSNTTVSFNPNPIPAPGSGTSAMTITVGSNTPTGTYPITVTGNGGGIQQNTTVTLTVITQQQQQAPPNGMVGYGLNSSNIPPGIRASFEAWLSANFQMVISGGLDLTAYRGPGNAWPGYVDGCCILLTDIYSYVLETAATQGWSDPDGPFLHMNIDYQPSPPIYSGIDQFDAYEQKVGDSPGRPAYAINGIFTLDGSTYKDVTVRAYCPTSGIPTDYWGTALTIQRVRSRFQTACSLGIRYRSTRSTLPCTPRVPGAQ